MKVVFIAYFFKPYPGVGAQRVTYWSDNASQFGIKPEVITTVEQEEQTEYPIHVVANTEKKRRLSSVIKDQGYSWYLDLKKFITEHNFKNVEAFVITGGPFMHFEIAKDISRKYPASRIVLDYRDPFGHNPRFNDGKLKSSIKKYYEKKFNDYADIILTVNAYCAKYIQTNKVVEVIDNGYDEGAFEDINMIKNQPSIATFNIAHAGSLYVDRNPTNFLKVITTPEFLGNVYFDQFGSESEYLSPFLSFENVKYKGKLNYYELIQRLVNYDCLILFTSGDPFESTTKIFDYMALNQRVILVTEGELYTGALHEITKDYPNILWVKNNGQAIKNALLEIQLMPIEKFEALSYSRFESLRKLVKLLHDK